MSFEIRRVEDLETFNKIIKLSKEVFGFEDIELIPAHIFLIAAKTGGQVLGAFSAQGELVGFSLAFLSYDKKNKTNYLSSHIAGVRSDLQSKSLGFAIKQAQKTDALENGLSLIKWTYDPLISKNANLNIRKLGGRIYKFIPNFYGKIGSELYSEVPSDRFEVTWDLSDDAPIEFPNEPEQAIQIRNSAPSVSSKVLTSGAKNILCPFPLDILGMRKENFELAISWSKAIAQVSSNLLDGQYCVAGFRVNDKAKVAEYLFKKLG